MTRRIAALAAGLLLLGCASPAPPPPETTVDVPKDAPPAAPTEASEAVPTEASEAVPTEAPKAEPLLIKAPDVPERSFDEVYFAARPALGDGWDLYLANYPLGKDPKQPPIADKDKLRVSLKVVNAKGDSEKLPPLGLYLADTEEGTKPRTPPTGDYVHKVRFAAFDEDHDSEANAWEGAAEGTLEVTAIDADELEIDVNLSGSDWHIRGKVTAARHAE